jgi:hypothetical protein
MAEIPVGRVSDDGLWQWNGKKWAHVVEVAIKCGQCESVFAVKEREKDFTCPSGHRHAFVACERCRAPFQLARSARMPVRCPHCGGNCSNVVPVAAWAWAGDQYARGLWPPGASGDVDPDRRIIRGFTLEAAGGTRIPIGSGCQIDFAREAITIKAGYGVAEQVSYAQVHALQVTGSTTRTGGGAIGGGFGVEGMAEGMMVAGVINALTSRTSTYCVIRLATNSAEYVFASYDQDSSVVQMLLTPVQLRIRQGQAAAQPPPVSSGPPASSSSIADELTKLARLRDDGVLNDAEFASAKARLLGQA